MPRALARRIRKRRLSRHSSRQRTPVRELLQRRGGEEERHWTEEARQMGYGHASSVTMLLKRLEQEATRNEELRQKLETLKTSIKSEM